MKPGRYYDRLVNLNNELGGGIQIHEVTNDSIITEDLITQVALGKIPYTVADNDLAKLNKTYYPNLNIDLSIEKQIMLLLVAMLSSKGAAGVTGAGFVTLAATLAVVPEIPIAGMTLILGIDKFMSECRALTNVIGNSVATVVVANWEKQLDKEQLKYCLANPNKIEKKLEI